MKELQDSFFEKAVSFAVNLPHWCEAKDLPETEAAVRFAEDGLYIRMCCKEKDPKRVYQNKNDPVYEDSCMECFLSADRSVGYLNLECNANGAMLAAFGKDRSHRTFLADDLRPECLVTRTGQNWTVTLYLPDTLFEALYPDGRKEPLCGNFYKCGDKTEHPHFGAAAPIDSAVPDFHLPQFFIPIIDPERMETI